MYAFDKRTSQFFTLLCTVLFFFPKINLISISEREAAGIRADDLILLFVSFLLFWGHTATKQPLSKIEKNLFYIVIFSIFSFFSNRLFAHMKMIHVDANILYALRILEYFLFYYIGYYAYRAFKLNTLVLLYFFGNAFFMILQRIEWVGYWGLYGYEPTCSYRCSGITSFPSEMGMLLNLLFCYMLCNQSQIFLVLKKIFRRDPFLVFIFSQFYPFLLFSLIAGLLLINGSRISFLAHCIVFILYLVKKTKHPFILITALIISGISAGYLHQSNVIQSSTLVSRSSTVFSTQNLDLIQRVWKSIDVSYDPIGKEVIPHDSTKEDTSWWMRIHKWLYALKIYLEHPESYFQGIGPGFAMAALDGGVLRIFVEYGIIGFILFSQLFYRIAKVSETLEYCIVAFLINMVFIDVYLAYKPMAFIFFMTGYLYAEDMRKNFQFKRSVAKSTILPEF